MNWLLLCKLLGMLGMLLGGSMILSLPWAFPVCGQTSTFESNGFWGLLGALTCSLSVGGILFGIGRKETSSILRKEALATVGLGWILVGFLGGLPYLFADVQRMEGISMSVPDAFFESVSGFTTTGASVLTELEDPSYIPRCVMFWRCFTHWLGGMGIIVLFVALLSQLGAGGKALLRREVPGPMGDTVRPRVQETALVMWTIYVLISATLAFIYLVQGMSLYDALCHSFGTMATGGFSTYNKSLGHFQSLPIEMTTILFMVIAGTNFSLFYVIWKGSYVPGKKTSRWHLGKRFLPLIQDREFQTYIAILVISTLLLTFTLWKNQIYNSISESLRHSSFYSVAIMTTTGYGTEDFTNWGEFSKGLLLLLMFVGGSAGSTGGGLKVIRMILFIKVLRLEIERAFRPHVVRPLTLAGNQVDESQKHDVMVYFSLVLLIFILGWLTLSTIEPHTQWLGETDVQGEKLLDCASAVAATLNNIGPGIGVVGPHSNYSQFSDPGKLLLALLMLLGRLELFTILVLFFPSFWKDQ